MKVQILGLLLGLAMTDCAVAANAPPFHAGVSHLAVEDVVPFGVQTGEPAKLTGIFHPAGSELTVAHATRSKIDAFGIQYEGTAGFSTSRFSWAA